ncbi:hypothetical protein BGZ51_004674 [Haplosporangium sp. Z 767]|nr:hypothetical protein BGZ50_008506 [Haplosporangium sp. Z 11]KAF9182555.1 hypothetical protein BGZ51_004674 [Haplosporangium sp. Z 767]
MTSDPNIQPEKFKIIIVGAGICGLMTAIQLERAGMDYIIFEKAKECLPLGSALSLASSCCYIFDQLGMLEDLQKVSLPCQKIDYIKDDLSRVGTMDAGNVKERYGYGAILITRPAFYDVLLSRVPPHKIQWGKRILGFEQNQYGVMVRIADNTTHHADILIGADGAYSAVRQTLYKSMLKKGLKVPKSDMAPLRFDSNCVIGVTNVLTEEEYPVLKDKTGDFHVIIGKERSIQVYLFTFAENRIGWQICGTMENPEDHDEQNFRFSDWMPVAADELCDQVRHFKCPFGGTLGDLMDRTPKERLSKVMLEDKYFHTWWHMRTVLMGDACHKHLPFGGQGANQAILDSVHLVNQLYAIPSNSLEDVAKSFKAYYAYRSASARDIYKGTSMLASMLSNRGFGSDTIRSLVLAKAPRWVTEMGMDGVHADRPVLCFLPPPNATASIKGKSQAVPVHYKEVLKAKGLKGGSSILSSNTI